MKINFSSGIGRKIIAYTLTGAMVTLVVANAKQKSHIETEEEFVFSDLVNGFYYDEDVKRNKKELIDKITAGGEENSKTYIKTNNVNILTKKNIK